MSSINYISNRAPLISNFLSTLPLGAAKPKGWLYNQLKIQSQGLTGHLDEFWDSVGPYSGWLGGTGENWERGPYYLDGLVPLGYLLEDEKLIEKAQKWIEWSIQSQTEDGNFGPQQNTDWWPRMVMLKVLIQYYEAAGDERVIKLMTSYFHYVRANIVDKPLFSWGQARGGEFLYSIFWLYNRTGEEELLELAEIIFSQTKDWTDIFTNFPFTKPSGFYYNWDCLKSQSWDAINNLMQYHATHVVNVAMGVKEPGLYYQLSGDEKHKKAVYDAIENLKKYHGQVTGMFSGDEHLSGANPTQGTELCSVVEYMFTLQTLLEALGDVGFADILERVAYNALPAAITKDFNAHQYDQQVNQVMVTKAKRKWFNNADDSNIFGLEPNFGCCTANMHQGWPKFIKNLWMATGDNGLAAVVYAPSIVNARVAEGANISIDEETDYPFDGVINFKLGTEKTVSFPLRLRIPSWCTQPCIEINGQKLDFTVDRGFIVINRVWNNGDTVKLILPMEVNITSWYNSSAAVEMGPIVFALKIGEEWRKLRSIGPAEDWEVYPTTNWNYALVLDAACPLSSFEIIKSKVPYQPFDSLCAPIVLKGRGRRVEEWQIENNSAGELPVSPVNCSGHDEVIELVPYGAAKLRIAAFPYTNK